MKKMIALGLIFFSVMAVCLQTGTRAENTDVAGSLINRYRQETKCEKVSVVLYDRGSVTYYGDNEGLYQIGSMTKAFTGLAVCTLINEGLINEDGAVSDYIPGFTAYYDQEEACITVKDLLEQKSGYTNNGNDFPGAAKNMTLSEWAYTVSGSELKSRPGTEYVYSNINYDLLGLIVENVSGMSYRDYMEQEILLPLGLKDTTVGMPSDKRTVEGTRLGYRRVYEYPLTVKEADIPAGYFYSNTADMARWIEIWTTGKNVPKNLIGPLSDIKDRLKNEGDYYSGWEFFSVDVTGHSGGTPNYSSRIVFDEKKMIGVCVLAGLNVAATTDGLCNGLFDVLSGKTPERPVSDVWTIFDMVFSYVTVIGVLLFPVILITKRRALLIILGLSLTVLLVSVLILFPVIFGAGIKDIIFIWAPLSLAGGLATVAADIAGADVRIFTGIINADNYKTGKRQTADGHNRISGKNRFRDGTCA